MKTRTRHGIILIGVVTVLTSLLFVYNSTSADTPGDQLHSDGHQIDAASRQTFSLEGYISITDHKVIEHKVYYVHKTPCSHHCLHPQPLKTHCRSCALVTSSGHMTGSGRGAEIDETECVIRMNDAPTRRYQKDVGQHTNLRVIAHSSMQRVLRNRYELLNSSQDTFFIFWGPGNYMRRDGKGLVYNNLRLMKQLMPKLQVYIISRPKMLQFDELFKKETGKDRKRSNSWLSTGWFTMAIAIEMCDRINVYGMVPPEFCKIMGAAGLMGYHATSFACPAQQRQSLRKSWEIGGL